MTAPSTSTTPSSRVSAIAASIAAVLLVAACSSDNPKRPDASDAPTTTASESVVPGGDPGVPPAPTEPAEPEALEEARTAVGPILDQSPVPPVVADCVHHRVAATPEIVGDADADDPDTWGPVLDVAAGCTHATVAAPAFADEQQRAADGALTDDQLACLRDGYADLTADEAQALTDAALAPGPGATTPPALADIFASCEVAPGS